MFLLTNRSRVYLLVCALGLLFILSSCSTPATISPSDVEEGNASMQLPKATELTLALKDIAQATAILAEDPEFRVWLKDEAMKQFDGDYDVLWQHHLNHQFPDGQSLRAKMVEALAAH